MVSLSERIRPWLVPALIVVTLTIIWWLASMFIRECPPFLKLLIAILTLAWSLVLIVASLRRVADALLRFQLPELPVVSLLFFLGLLLATIFQFLVALLSLPGKVIHLKPPSIDSS